VKLQTSIDAINEFNAKLKEVEKLLEGERQHNKVLQMQCQEEKSRVLATENEIQILLLQVYQFFL